MHYFLIRQNTGCRGALLADFQECAGMIPAVSGRFAAVPMGQSLINRRCCSRFPGPVLDFRRSAPLSPLPVHGRQDGHRCTASTLAVADRLDGLQTVDCEAIELREQNAKQFYGFLGREICRNGGEISEIGKEDRLWLPE